MTDAKKRPAHLLVVLVAIAAVILLKRPWEGLAVRPAPDLLRLEIPEGFGTVTEHHAKGLEVAADDWILSGRAENRSPGRDHQRSPFPCRSLKLARGGRETA